MADAEAVAVFFRRVRVRFFFGGVSAVRFEVSVTAVCSAAAAIGFASCVGRAGAITRGLLGAFGACGCSDVTGGCMTSAISFSMLARSRA